MTDGARLAEATGGRLVVGVGVSSAATAEGVLACLHELAEVEGITLQPSLVAEVRTLDRKAEHPVVRELAQRLDAPVVGYPADVLARQVVTHRSERALAETGTPSVAEAAVAVGGGRLLAHRAGCRGATLALGRYVDLTHHGDDEARRAGVHLDLAVNVAVPAPPAFVREAVVAALADLAAYPDAAPTTAHVARHLGVEPASVLLTNGAAQAFTLVAHLRPWQHAVVVHPQFTEPEAALRAAGAVVHQDVLPAPYPLDASVLGAEHGDADLVVVGNPTNPTSVLHPREVVLAARPRDGVLLVDEAFIDTCTDPGQSVLAEAAVPGSGILVTRSFTKTFGLAGLRAGAVVGDPALVARLRELQPHWSVSTPALAAVRACCSDEGEAFTAAQRDRLGRNARQLAEAGSELGILATEPQAPFVLLHDPRLPLVRERLLDAGVATRSCASFPGLGPEHLRLAARDPADLAPALDVIREHLAPTTLSPHHPTQNPQEHP